MSISDEHRSPSLAAAAAALLLLLSCSAGTGVAPKPGTPAFYWNAAQETYAVGNYLKTIEHLDELLASDTEYTPRALTWSLVLSSGLINGYAELADHYQAGARANPERGAANFRQVNAYRAHANRLALEFAENFQTFLSGPAAPAPLQFAWPGGDAAPVSETQSVAKGMALPAAIEEEMARRVIRRGVLLAISRAAGAEDSAEQAGKMFESAAAVEVPRGDFVLAMAGTLYEASQLYTRDRIDDTPKMRILCQRARDALKLVPPCEQAERLSNKIHFILDKPEGL